TFGNAFSKEFSSVFDTHPPLHQRIKAVLPSWDGTFNPVTPPNIAAGRSARNEERHAHLVSNLAGPMLPHPTESVDRMGNVTHAEIAVAQQIKAAIPEPWLQLIRSTSGAQAMIFALLISHDDE